jgi:hypothetical protein
LAIFDPKTWIPARRFEEEIAATDPDRAAGLCYATEIRQLAIRREVRRITLTRKLKACADWATPCRPQSHCRATRKKYVIIVIVIVIIVVYNGVDNASIIDIDIAIHSSTLLTIPFLFSHSPSSIHSDGLPKPFQNPVVKPYSGLGNGTPPARRNATCSQLLTRSFT